MKALILAVLCASRAAAWSWGTERSGEAIFEVESTGSPSVDNALADRAVDVLKRRLAAFGLTGGVERRAGLRVAVTVTSRDDDPMILLRPLLKPSRLEFRMAHPERSKPGPGETTVVEFLLDAKTGELRQERRVVDKAVLMNGSDLVSASAGLTVGDPAPSVALEFSAAGAKKLAAATEKAVGRAMAIVVDGRFLSSPVIYSPIMGGRLSLSGNFTAREASDLARALSSGPLPERLTLISPAPAAPPVAAKAPPAEVPAPVIVSDVDAPPPALARGRANGVAVVIGVERTRQGLPRADFAAKDASVFASYLVKTLGYPEENVVLLLDDRAAKSDLEKYLEDWLPRKAASGATVVVFFSGHGAPDAARGTSFLVPYDGDPAFLAKTAYPLARLYETLGKLKGRRSIVLLDACFSGAGRRSALAKGARPLVAKHEEAEPPANLAVLSAAASNQIGGSLDAQGHGLFTYYVLRALRDAAAAGRAPTMQELFDSVSGKVESEARRLSGNEQTPQLQAAAAARSGSL